MTMHNTHDTFQPNDQVRDRITGRTGIVLAPQPFQRKGTYRVRFYDDDAVYHAPERNLSEMRPTRPKEYGL